MRRGRAAHAAAALATLLALSPAALRAQPCPVAPGMGVAQDASDVHAPFAAMRRFADFENGARPFDVSAPGRVFLEDPSRGEPVEVTLERLSGIGDRLDGRYARVTSRKLDGGEAIAGVDGLADFRYPFFESKPDCDFDADACARFDAVNVYWHVDRMATAFWRDRLGIEVPFQTTFIVHEAGNGGYSFPDQRRVLVRLGGEDFDNAALSDDVIYHEYSHVVLWAEGFRSDTMAAEEARAISEGYADYMTATFTDHPVLGEYARACPSRAECVGDPNQIGFRRLDTDPVEWNWRFGNPDETLQYGRCLRFNPDDGKCKPTWASRLYYARAMIWGGALWDLRSALGAPIVDGMILDAIRMDDAGTTSFGRAAGYLLEAAASRTDDAGVDTVRAVLRRRGIEASGMAVERDGPTGGTRLLMFPNPVGDRLTIEVASVDPGDLVVRLVDATGRVVLRLSGRAAAPGAWQRTIDIGELASGVYLAEIVLPSGRRLARPFARP